MFYRRRFIRCRRRSLTDPEVNRRSVQSFRLCAAPKSPEGLNTFSLSTPLNQLLHSCEAMALRHIELQLSPPPGRGTGAWKNSSAHSPTAKLCRSGAAWNRSAGRISRTKQPKRVAGVCADYIREMALLLRQTTQRFWGETGEPFRAYTF